MVGGYVENELVKHAYYFTPLKGLPLSAKRGWRASSIVIY
jgi:hypothetical protein